MKLSFLNIVAVSLAIFGVALFLASLPAQRATTAVGSESNAQSELLINTFLPI